MRFLVACSVAVLASLAGCGSTPPVDDGSPYPEAARIRVTIAPSADFDGTDVRTVEVEDAATVRRWREALNAVPVEPPLGVRNVSFLPDTVEHRIEFLDEAGVVVGEHRMKGNMLDVAALPAWQFYSGEDEGFVVLVEELFDAE